MKNKFALISTRIIGIIILIFGIFQMFYINNLKNPNYHTLFNENKEIELILTLVFACCSFVIAFGLWKLKK